MGNKRFDSLEDFTRHRCAIEVTCACGHKGLLDPAYVVDTFMRRRWPTNSLVTARDHLRCSRCRGRPVWIGPGER